MGLSIMPSWLPMPSECILGMYLKCRKEKTAWLSPPIFVLFCVLPIARSVTISCRTRSQLQHGQCQATHLGKPHGIFNVGAVLLETLWHSTVLDLPILLLPLPPNPPTPTLPFEKAVEVCGVEWKARMSPRSTLDQYKHPPIDWMG